MLSFGPFRIKKEKNKALVEKKTLQGKEESVTVNHLNRGI